MSVKISELPSIEVDSLVAAGTSSIPLIAGNANVFTYQTSVANVKTYVETGNLNVTGAVYANLTSYFANLTITGNLNVQGTTTTTSSENLSTNSSIIDLHTFSSNLDPWTSDDGRDIGLRFFWYKSGVGAGTSALVWENDNSYLTWYSSGVGNANTGTISGTLGTFQTGQVLIANATTTTANATGALQVSGGTSIAGNLWTGSQIINTGNITTTGKVTSQTLEVNNSTTIGGTLSTVGATTAQSLNVNTVASIGSTLVVGSTLTANAITSNSTVSGSTGSFTTVGAGTLGVSGTGTIDVLAVNTTSTFSGTITGRAILPDSNVTYNLGSSTYRYNTVYAAEFSGVATSALYADLAEKYLADFNYEPGTVVIFGGEAEITVTSVEQDSRVAGVISTDPAYLMNSESSGLPVALRGKVPVNVIGPVNKGALLVTSTTPGYACAVPPNTPVVDGAIVAKSLVTDHNLVPRAIVAVIV